MSIESKIAVFKSGNACGLQEPVCPVAEFRYYRWLSSLLATGQKLIISKGLMVDRRLNIFEATFSQKDIGFGKQSLIICGLEHPVLAFPFKAGVNDEGEVFFWLESGVDFVDFDGLVSGMALRQVWGDPQSAPSWYYENCKQVAKKIESAKLRTNLVAIIKRRDKNWMLDSINLMLRNLEKVETK